MNKLMRSALQCFQEGNLEHAKSLFEQILQNQPRDATILYFLGIICTQLNNFDLATHYLRKSLEIQTINPDACFALGMVLYQKGIKEEALIYFQKTLDLNPNTVGAYHYLADIFRSEKQFNEAIKCLKKLLHLEPNNARISYDLALLLYEDGQCDEAACFFQKALELDPVFVDAYNGLGNILQEKREFDKAISYYQNALRINPSNPTAYINLGIAHHNIGQYDKAISFFIKALELNQNLIDAHHHMGLSLIQQGKLEEALQSYSTLLRIDPHSAIALCNCGYILSKQGKNNESESFFRRAIQDHPNYVLAYQGLLMTMIYNPRYDAMTIVSAHRHFANQYLRTFTAYTFPHTKNRSLNRRLKIGYVSPDFKRHSVAYFIEPVLALHNRQEFEVFCYSAVEFPDETTERIKHFSDSFTDIFRCSDEKAADLIRKDEIDILIDLAGYSRNNRTLLFAYKPSPVQVSWIGYPVSTGLPTIDYKIVDHYTDPPGMTEQFYTEQLMRLPECFLCYLPFSGSPEVIDLPALSSGHVTFGSFNSFSKISPEIVSLWIELLKRVPNSRFIIKADSLSDRMTRTYAMNMFDAGGIEKERIYLCKWVSSIKDHLNSYNHIDIALDTFPYNGTTTTCEALWMGVPVITLAGNTHASRVGVSLLSNLGLPDLIAKSPEEYIAIAVGLANNISKLQSLRHNLRDMMSRSPVMDGNRFIIHLENCYRSIWESWYKTV